MRRQCSGEPTKTRPAPGARFATKDEFLAREMNMSFRLSSTKVTSARRTMHLTARQNASLWRSTIGTVASKSTSTP